MGISKNLTEAATIKTVPYVGFVSPPQDASTISDAPIAGNAIDLMARAISNGQPHLALPLTVSLCLAVAASIPGTVVSEVRSTQNSTKEDAASTTRIGMPSGILTVGAQVSLQPSGWTAHRGSFYRTARRLFAGEVYPQDVEASV
jgi:2-methylaconitate cis-trans-isomerase PrpF